MQNRHVNYTRVRYKTYMVFFIVNIITSFVGSVINYGGPLPIVMIQLFNALISVLFIFIIHKIIQSPLLKNIILLYYLIVINIGMWIGTGVSHPLFIAYSIMLVQLFLLTSDQSKRILTIIGFVCLFFALGVIDVYFRKLTLANEMPMNLENLISIISILVGNLIILHFNKYEIENINDNITDISYQDELTDAKNRRAFFEDIANLEFAYKEFSKNYMVVYLDIDSLKSINDDYGHHEGDRAIIAISKLVASEIRTGDGFYRLGGDEFVLLFTALQETELQKKFKTIKHNLMTKYHFQYPLDFSYGYDYRKGNESMESVMKSADSRMYEMKQSKKEQLKKSI